MSEAVLQPGVDLARLGRQSVELTARLWFTVAAVGHWLFVAYILAVFYPPIAARGLSGLEGMHLPIRFHRGRPRWQSRIGQSCVARGAGDRRRTAATHPRDPYSFPDVSPLPRPQLCAGRGRERHRWSVHDLD